MDIWAGGMIRNEIGRSLEFVTNPEQAGLQAKAMPFSLQTIFALFLLCSIISVVVASFLTQVMPETSSEIVIPATATDFEKIVYNQLQTILNFFNHNPIITVALSAVFGIASSLILFAIGRNFSPSIDFIASQSALVRFEVVTTFAINILQVFAIVFYMLSSSMGSAFSTVITFLGIAILLLKIHFIRGVFEVAGFGKAFQIWFLSVLSLFVFGFFMSLIFVAIML